MLRLLNKERHEVEVEVGLYADVVSSHAVEYREGAGQGWIIMDPFPIFAFIG